VKLSDWFLTPSERGNPATRIDDAHPGEAWTEGNKVELLVHGRTYYRRLHGELCRTAPGDAVRFTDWRGDPDERLAGPGTEVARVLATLAERGVDVRGLVWRSHLDQAHFSEQENLHLVETVNEAGGEVILDERVRRAGSHHQKLFVIRHPSSVRDDVAYVGGTDLCHGRNDDVHHAGDEQIIRIDERYGPRPPWHDAQLEVRGPAVADLDATFAERWNDPLPPDHGPWGKWIARRAHEGKLPRPLPENPAPPPRCGSHAVQVLRTYPAKRPRSRFAPQGERSVGRAYMKAFARARRLIYIEDQYLWSHDVQAVLAAALRRSPSLLVIAVVPRYPDEDGWLTGPPSRTAQRMAIDGVRDAGGERVAVYNLENERGWPIYVHAKVCIVDDVWMTVGSDNLNRRSWTHDSELSCAVIDGELDERLPRDPGGLGDGARRLVRDVRLQLWHEHLGTSDDEPLIDPQEGFQELQRSAQALERWHANGRTGPRPAGRLRPHLPEGVPAWVQPFSDLAYRTVIDPDGRPWRMRRRDLM
jgi:phosphatidylserine/phosphatidylglycerophosphate/cardiolipin synthase-like enzyme